MSFRKPLMEKSINSNINQELNFSFDKSTQKKPSKMENLQLDEVIKRPLKQKQLIDLFLGQLKEHNHEKMIHMFGELRKQNKQKDEKNQLLVNQLSDLQSEFKQIKLQYGRCLKQKTRLQQEVTAQSRQVSIYQTKSQSQERQLKELQKKLEENSYYKSQLFEANEKMNEYKKRFLDTDETVESEKEFKFKEMQWTYEMKLDECEQHIKELEKENWELGQIKIRNQTTIKKLNIELNEALIQLKKLTSSSNYSHKKSLHPASHINQEIETLKQQIQALEKQLDSTTESYELKVVQLEAQVELANFKTQTYAEHSQTLQDKLNLLQKDLSSFKQQSFTLHQKLQKQHNKALDLDTLINEVLLKLKQFSPENILIADYCLILNHKLERISGGKPVSFLKSDTKDFVSITSRSKDSKSYGPNSLTKLNQQLKLLKTHQKINTFESESSPSHRESFKSNYTSIKKIEQRESFSRNSVLSEIDASRFSQNQSQEKFDSKILEQRKELEKKIRQKYMKSRPKDLDEQSNLKENSIHYQLKESSVSSQGQKSPYFRRQDRESFYPTSEFQQ